MKIIEVRDGFIRFEADASVYLSSFVRVSGMDKSYIAQVVQIKKAGSVCVANAKMVFVMNNEGLKDYDKTEPSLDAEIEPFTQEVSKYLFNTRKPIILGKTLDNKNNIVIDDSVFNKNILFSIDSEDLNNLLVRNLVKQFENAKKNTVIIDTLGVIKSKKYVAGVDFKLPLDKSSLMFMYQSCLNDATAESKSMIVEIFKDLSEYADSVPFVPFDTLKSIVDDMVDKQHIFKLLVLKNKLAKFDKLGYFAANRKETENLQKILESNCAVIDLSKLDSLFQNRYIEFIYSSLGENTQVLFEVSNSVSKKSLKYVLSDSENSTAIITHSKYQYLNDIKDLFANFVIESSAANNLIFKDYSSFLSSMQENMYLIAGEGINNTPLISSAQIIDETMEYSSEPEIEENEELTGIVDEQNDDGLEEIVQEDAQEEDFEQLEEDVSLEETVEENLAEDVVESSLNQEEIIATIEEKSEGVINSVSENLEEPQDMDLFSDEENDLEEADETEFEPVEIAENDTPEEEVIIEPEYSEVQEEVIVEDINSEPEIVSELEEQPAEEEQILVEEVPEAVLNESAEDISIGLEEEIIEYNNSENEPLIDDNVQEDFLQQEEFTELSLEDETEEVVEQEEELSVHLNDEEDILLKEIDSFCEVEETEENDESLSSMQDVDLEQPQDVILLKQDDDFQEFEEIVELDPSETDESDIVVDMSQEGDDNINIDEELEQQIVEDVDKVYTTMKTTDELEEISDSDLDLIDELNNDGDILEEFADDDGELSELSEEILEQPQESIIPERIEPQSEIPEILEKREANTPIVPVYDADIPQEDMVMSDPIQQGDTVIHAKYGNGVVEKMIKYGTKTLFSINFENIGRRLLDPTLTEIKKL